MCSDAPERLDPLHASLMNGISSHVEDYDDTTPKNYSHTTSPVASALFAYASANPVGGRDFVEAFILGFEAASRVATRCIRRTTTSAGT
jgi:2-methylcitrate dehydratase PrpD